MSQPQTTRLELHVREYLLFRFREYLAHPDHTKRTLAALLGVSEAAMSRYHSGETNVGAKVLRGAAAAWFAGDAAELLRSARQWQADRDATDRSAVGLRTLSAEAEPSAKPARK